MAYTAILDTQVDPDAPITSGLGYQLRDNPEAIAAGDSGAPRVVSRALGLTTISGSGTYNGATIDSIDMGANGYDIVFLHAAGEYVSTDIGSSSVQLEGSQNNTTWTGIATIVTSSAANEDTSVYGSTIYNGNGGTQYRYYRLREAGDSDKEFTGSATAVFIGGDTS